MEGDYSTDQGRVRLPEKMIPNPVHMASLTHLRDLRLTYSDARVRVCCLHQLFALVTNDPVGINLCGPLGIQRDHLEVSEVCLGDGVVLGTHIINIWDVIIVKVIFTNITSAVAYG